MHPILEIALGVALGMTVFLVITWVLGMCVYVACNKSENIATSKKIKIFKGSCSGDSCPKETVIVNQDVTQETSEPSV
jgi:hypothetical protein